MKIILSALFLFISTLSFTQNQKNWTIIYYAAGSNSSETDLLDDIGEMQIGKQSDDYNLITLIDRVPGFSEDSTTLDGNFSDTRLYSIGNKAYTRLEGEEFFPEIGKNKQHEANMGDAKTLKKFIQYCKHHYPAKHYMLVLRSHGNGLGMCPDAEHGDRDKLYTAELTQVLTQQESVDILGLDVCSMAGLENLYQWRPQNQSFSAQYVIASSPLSGAWAYDKILERITATPAPGLQLDSNYFEGGSETVLDPATMSPLAFSTLIFEEIYDNQRWASWGLFDNSHIGALKVAVDEAAQLLALEDKTTMNTIIANTLGYHHNTANNLEVAELTFPYLDAYHFWLQIAEAPSLSSAVKDKAKGVCSLVDDLVIHSYYGNGFLPETPHFINGKSGVYQITPQGSKVFSQTKNTYWSHCGWFHPDDQSQFQNSYGQYDWCKDGATRGNNKVDNFYEYLDFLFDENNTSKGGINNYQW